MIARVVQASTTVLLAAFCVFVFGLQSYTSMPRESAPDIPIPVVMVTTPYIGVAPADIEGLLTIPMENELASLQDVKAMRSTSAEGVSIISIEFEPDVDIDSAMQSVRDKVNKAKPKLPSDSEEPEVREISFSDFPILIITVAGGLDEEGLKELAEPLQDRLTRIPGVLDVNLSGGLTREIQVQIDPIRLSHYALGLQDVANAISAENVNIPGGEVSATDASILLRVPGDFTSPAQLEEVAIKRRGDRPVFVRDVATVVDTYADRGSYARMDGQPAVSLSVTKRSGANIIEVVEAAKVTTTELSAGWPDGVRHAFLSDQSVAIKDMVSDLENNIITGLILVVGVVLFAMGVRNSLFVALAIPLSMLMAMIVLQSLGFTLNMVVLFSLILALGMLVDNAIVVVENIYRHMELGKSTVQASVDGTREVAVAVAASTATTVAAFLPLVFWTGIMGGFMGYLPKTLIAVLVASLVVAVFILPVFTAVFMKVSKGVRGPDHVAADGPIMGPYRRILAWSIDHRYVSAFAGLAVLIVSFMAYGQLNHGTEFFPSTQPERGFITVRAPDGTDLETTDRITRRIEAALALERNIEVAVAETGVAGGGQDFGGAQSAPNQATISLDFLPDRNAAEEGEEIRDESSLVTIDRLRDIVSGIPGAELAVDKENMGPPVGAPISVEVSGEDFHQVGELAKQVRRTLKALPGVTELADDYRVGRPELRLRVDRGAAKRVGLDTRTVGNTVRTAVAGQVASTLRQGDDEHDIVVTLAPRYRGDVQSVLDLRLPGSEMTSPDKFPVPMSSVASFELAGGSGAIRHLDQDLVVTITGDILEGFNENAVRADVQAALDSYPTPAGFHLRMGGADDEQRSAQAFLSRAFMIALALILLVLVTQFDSLFMPGIILASVVLSLVGVLWGLVITGTPFGIMMTGIGVISLAGVVVNNAIVLLDYVEQLRDRGLDMREALIEGGMTRFRPVVLTAITTILGLVPMATGISYDFTRMRLLVGSSSTGFWGPMAVAVIFGLLFATLLTLVMVPTLYGIAEDAQGLLRRLTGRRVPVAAKVGLASLLVAGASLPASAMTLDQALAAAEANNLDLAMAQAQADQVSTLKGQAWSAIAPKVQLSGSWTRNEYPIELDSSAMIPEEFQEFIDEPAEPIVIQEQQFWQGNASVIQPLFSGEALPTLRGTYSLTRAVQADVAGARLRVRAGAAQAFYMLASSREAVRLAQASVENARHQLSLAERQVSAGVAPQRAVLQGQLGVSVAERQVAMTREQVAMAEASFERLTGLAAPDALELPELPAVPGTLDDALQQALAHRPELTAAAERLRVAQLQRQVEIGSFMPDLNARFTYNYTQNTGFSDDPTMWMFVASGDWTIFAGGYRKAKLQESAHGLRVAELAVQHAQASTTEEVKLAWERHQRAEGSSDAVARERALAAESLKLAERAFGAGSSTWLEVEEARLMVDQAHLNELLDQVERDMAKVQLLAAVGRF